MSTILGAVGAGLGLATEVFKWLNNKELTKYIDEAVELAEDIQKELEKPYDQQDDVKIVHLRKRAVYIMEAAKSQLALRNSSQ